MGRLSEVGIRPVEESSDGSRTSVCVVSGMGAEVGMEGRNLWGRKSGRSYLLPIRILSSAGFSTNSRMSSKA